MTKGVGGSTIERELEKLGAGMGAVEPIGPEEYRMRQQRAQALMRAEGLTALFLDASTNLFYFTGLRFGPSERLHGAVLPVDGAPVYISPNFEVPRTQALLDAGADVRGWHEHEDPALLVAAALEEVNGSGGVGLDPNMPLFTYTAFVSAMPQRRLMDATAIVSACRIRKSPGEIALMKHANRINHAVQKSTAAILHEGITTAQVQAFIGRAYAAAGGTLPPDSAIVLFGEASAFPHGVSYSQTLRQNEIVLVDIWGSYRGYRADSTRTYVFGTPSERQRFIWATEAKAQQAAFEAAQIGATFASVDKAARDVIEAAGFEAGYGVPGLPHRTGHGIGLDGHEYGYVVAGNSQGLEKGMCFSIEPMITSYGEFGVRLEDCIYMTETGPKWFSPPSRSIDEPFEAEK